MVTLSASASLCLGACALWAIVVLAVSLQRSQQARRIYVQTAEALAMIPEVAGLVPLGHGERTSIYAAALAEHLGLRGRDVFLVEAAARLHHVGEIAVPPVGPPGAPHSNGVVKSTDAAMGTAGAIILAGPSFLGDVAALVAGVTSPATGGLSEAAVRVASSLDDLVGEEPAGLGDALVGLLARHDKGIERTAALALAHLANARPSLAHRAVAAGNAAVSESAGTLV